MPVRCLSDTAVLCIMYCFLDFVVLLTNVFGLSTPLKLRMRFAPPIS
jgi:hypothetical protein